MPIKWGQNDHLCFFYKSQCLKHKKISQKLKKENKTKIKKIRDVIILCKLYILFSWFGGHTW